jgi:hypothetical protein
VLSTLGLRFRARVARVLAKAKSVLLPAAPLRGHEVGLLQHGEVLRDRLARHVQPFAKLGKRLSAPFVQAIDERSPAWIRGALNTLSLSFMRTCRP